MDTLTIQKLRDQYQQQGFSLSDADANPFTQFQRWFDDTRNAALYQPHVMTLATATADGQPSARLVALRGHDERGFIFYTDQRSRKADELAHNPRAALVFDWGELARQVRVEGYVERVSDAEADAFFPQLRWGSRLSVWASHQSEPMEERATLEQRLLSLIVQYEQRDVPRPAHWIGYRVRPVMFEFWQGRDDFLHDRVRYRLIDRRWAVDCLSP
jgi:pyridoxamine 5'-phosphate oxidase